MADDDKDHRRLDTDGDLLEEFLENEGKILRLPTGGDLDIDIDELTKVIISILFIYILIIQLNDLIQLVELDVYEEKSAGQEQVCGGKATDRRPRRLCQSLAHHEQKCHSRSTDSFRDG